MLIDLLPYMGDPTRYGLGPEHIFFKTLNAAAAQPTPTSSPIEKAIKNLLGQNDGGGAPGGGNPGLGIGPSDSPSEGGFGQGQGGIGGVAGTSGVSGGPPGGNATADKSTAVDTSFGDFAGHVGLGLGIGSFGGLVNGFSHAITGKGILGHLRDWAFPATQTEVESEPYGGLYGNDPPSEGKSPGIGSPSQGYGVGDQTDSPAAGSGAPGNDAGTTGANAGPGPGGDAGGAQLRRGGLITLAGGGVVAGPGGGMDDAVPAMIDNVQPAALSSDEFVVPADVVSALGDGSSKQGAKKLYDLIKNVRMAKHGTARQPPQLKQGISTLLGMARGP